MERLFHPELSKGFTNPLRLFLFLAVHPFLALSTLSVNFGQADLLTGPANMTLTIANIGQSNLTLKAFSLTTNPGKKPTF